METKMREIKFRFWMTNDDYPKGHLYSTEENPCFGINAHGDVITLKPQHNVTTWARIANSQIILMQYTGLKDKNGKEIYEGDIVLQITYQGKSKEIVKFDKGCFYAGYHYGSSTRESPKLLSSKVEVIGNIYENPELLK